MIELPSVQIVSDHEQKQEIVVLPHIPCLSCLPLLPQSDSGLEAFTADLVMEVRNNQPKKPAVKIICLDRLFLYLSFLDFFPTTWCLYRQTPRVESSVAI